MAMMGRRLVVESRELRIPSLGRHNMRFPQLFIREENAATRD
jgi:hypothetical protein